MKKILLIALFVFSASFIYAQQAQKAPVTFDKVKHSFGKIPQGTPTSTTFTFTNNGNKPLVITHVMSSCGCTTPEFAKTPVMPGKKGTIKAGYNAADPGAFNRSLTVLFAGYQAMSLTIEGEVVPK
ncbi:DUF1573 domain-containing protein [Haoranjiania flava]|uniref:DUF1573 domain-containing protein n=1 Tax=Haoranjiania flava TaxID=1856322 RepID=A0AAE3LKK5_9BACT|nr:DUF1573 domain-containing protein [Haoranjiania flava]MCU7695022.1 DUF1573 domain-containing protein [Haoranjiania flava]